MATMEELIADFMDLMHPSASERRGKMATMEELIEDFMDLGEALESNKLILTPTMHRGIGDDWVKERSLEDHIFIPQDQDGRLLLVPESKTDWGDAFCSGVVETAEKHMKNMVKSRGGDGFSTDHVRTKDHKILVTVNGVSVREEVLRFALRMELALRDNDDKGGWKDSEATYLIGRLSEELEELNQAIQYPIFKEEDVPAKQRAVQNESADVANFLMMLLDNIGILKIDKKELEEYLV